MAKLKRTYIELVKNVEEVKKGGEPELEKVWTPYFLSWGEIRAGMQILMDKEEKSKSEFEIIEQMEDFVANTVFDGTITVKELQDRLHAPDAVRTIQEVIEFVTSGEESDELKAFLAKKN